MRSDVRLRCEGGCVLGRIVRLLTAETCPIYSGARPRESDLHFSFPPHYRPLRDPAKLRRRVPPAEPYSPVHSLLYNSNPRGAWSTRIPIFALNQLPTALHRFDAPHALAHASPRPSHILNVARHRHRASQLSHASIQRYHRHDRYDHYSFATSPTTHHGPP